MNALATKPRSSRLWSKRQTSPIGLHLGLRTVTLVQLTGAASDRRIHALAQAALPTVEERTPDEQDRETAATIKRLVGDHRFKGRRVVGCLGTQDLFVQNMRLPQMPAEEVEKVVQFEAKERLPYPPAEAEIRHLLAGEVRQENVVKQEVILLACQRAVIQRHIRLLEQAGLAPAAIDLEACALLRCLLREADETAGARSAYLDLGESATTVLFAEQGRILFLKTIATGGQHLDAALARALDLPLAEAVSMRNVVTAAETLDPENDVHRTVIDSIRTPLESIATEVELCLRYYKVTFRGRPLDRVCLTGSEASPWLCEFLSDRLGARCQLADPFAQLSQRPTSTATLERPTRWTTAVGLALKALE